MGRLPTGSGVPRRPPQPHSLSKGKLKASGGAPSNERGAGEARAAQLFVPIIRALAKLSR